MQMMLITQGYRFGKTRTGKRIHIWQGSHGNSLCGLVGSTGVRFNIGEAGYHSVHRNDLCGGCDQEAHLEPTPMSGVTTTIKEGNMPCKYCGSTGHANEHCDNASAQYRYADNVENALKTIREAGNNTHPTAAWMQKWAAYAMEPCKWPKPDAKPPKERLYSVPKGKCITCRKHGTEDCPLYGKSDLWGIDECDYAMKHTDPVHDESADTEPKNTCEFIACDTCRAKPGTPTLCHGCLNNRHAITTQKEIVEMLSGDRALLDNELYELKASRTAKQGKFVKGEDCSGLCGTCHYVKCITSLGICDDPKVHISTVLRSEDLAGQLLDKPYTSHGMNEEPVRGIKPGDVLFGHPNEVAEDIIKRHTTQESIAADLPNFRLYLIDWDHFPRPTIQSGGLCMIGDKATREPYRIIGYTDSEDWITRTKEVIEEHGKDYTDVQWNTVCDHMCNHRYAIGKLEIG